MSFENKCLGCGISLQNASPDEPGYVNSPEQKYCQRCFKLVHYGDTSKYIQRNYNKELKSIYAGYSNALYVLIVDCYEALVLDQENFIEQFRFNDVLFIVNKIDLLPNNVTDERINEIYTGVFRKIHKLYPNVKDMLLTHHKDSSFESLFYNCLEEFGYKKVVFVGKSNAGKSTIINRLLGNSNLTVSIYPGTTVGALEMEHNGYIFIDTPGIDDLDNILVNMPLDKLKKYLEYRTVKPLVYQVYEKQSFFMSKLFEIDVAPKKNCSVIFEAIHDDIHRTNFANRERYLQKKYEYTLLPWKRNDYTVKSMRTFLIKGFGLIRIKGEAKITIAINDKIRIYESEVFI